MAQTLVGIKATDDAFAAASPISFGPVFLRPVLTLLYGLLSIRPQLVLPRINRYTIPDFWNVVFRNPFRFNISADSQGVTQGVAVAASIMVLGFGVSVNGAVFRWSDLLALNVQVTCGTVGCGLGVNVAKPGTIMETARREGMAQGMAFARADAEATAQFQKAERAAARKTAKRRRR